MIELPVTSVDNLDAGEIVEQQTNDVQPLEPQEIVEPPIVISGQAGNPSRIRWKIFPDLSSNFETRNALQQVRQILKLKKFADFSKNDSIVNIAWQRLLAIINSTIRLH